MLLTPGERDPPPVYGTVRQGRVRGKWWGLEVWENGLTFDLTSARRPTSIDRSKHSNSSLLLFSLSYQRATVVVTIPGRQVESPGRYDDTIMGREDLLSRREVEGLIADGRSIVIVNQKVLKVDPWMKYHPGGDKAIMHMVGRDATDEVTA